MIMSDPTSDNERKIIRHIIRSLKAAGWALYQFYDGDVMLPVTTETEALTLAFTVDESWFYFKNGDNRHWVYFIIGNGNDGFDIITDYSIAEVGKDDGFEALMDKELKYASDLQGD
jgi:hypothetical protein